MRSMHTAFFTAIIIAVIMLATIPTVSAQADVALNRTDIDLSQNNFLIYNPCGEAIVVNSGKRADMFNLITDSNGTVHINWKLLMKGGGLGTVTFASYELINVQPYNFSGSADGFNYDSVGTMKLTSSFGTSTVKFTYHAAYSPESGLKVQIDNYRLVCNKQ